MEARQLVTQLAELAFTQEDTRSALEGVIPQESAGPDGVHPDLIKLLADALAELITTPFNRTLVDAIPADW